MRTLRALLIVITIAIVIPRPLGGATPVQEAAITAHHVLLLLQQGYYAAVAALIHDPPAPSEIEKAQNRAMLARGLAYLFGQFGAPAAAKLHEGPYTLLQVRGHARRSR